MFFQCYIQIFKCDTGRTIWICFLNVPPVTFYQGHPIICYFFILTENYSDNLILVCKKIIPYLTGKGLNKLLLG